MAPKTKTRTCPRAVTALYGRYEYRKKPVAITALILTFIIAASVKEVITLKFERSLN